MKTDNCYPGNDKMNQIPEFDTLEKMIAEKQYDRNTFKQKHIKYWPYTKREQKALDKWNEKNTDYHITLVNIGHKIMNKAYPETTEESIRDLTHTIVPEENKISEEIFDEIYEKIDQRLSLKLSLIPMDPMKVLLSGLAGSFIGTIVCSPINNPVVYTITLFGFTFATGEMIYDAISERPKKVERKKIREQANALSEEINTANGKLDYFNNAYQALWSFHNNSHKLFNKLEVVDHAEIIILDMVEKLAEGPA